MTPSFEEFVSVLRDVFGQYHLPLSRQTASAQVPGWDSLNHTALLIELEDRFGVALSSDETASLADIGALFDLLVSRQQ